MPDAPMQLLCELVTAHRILVNEAVLDAFGHVSLRDPNSPDIFWLAAALPPSTVGVSDMLAFGLDGEPLVATDMPLFAERFIHSEIYRARGDVMSVCHHHSPSIMPYCIGDRPLLPVSQTGAFMGGAAPLWDSADEFGDTGMLVNDSAQAASLARALAQRPLVLMRGHGATVVGSGIKDTVFKSVYSCREADHQLKAAALGGFKPLSSGEAEKAGRVRPAAVDRCWAHWTAALARMTGMQNEGLSG